MPGQALVRASDADVQALIAQHAHADLAISAETVAIRDLLPGLERLVRARDHGHHRGQLVVRAGTAAREDLHQLARAGVTAVAWTVRAPTVRAALLQGGTDVEVLHLREAMQHAADAGLTVHLRWRLLQAAVPALAELSDLVRDAPAGTHLVILPALGEAAPDLHTVAAYWPRAELPGLTLVRSALWPACLDVHGDAIEPVSAGQLRAAQVAQVPACQGCPHSRACPGIAASLVTALDRQGHPFTGWTHPDTVPRALPPEPLPPLDGPGFDPMCAEARGLHLGLRRAWRLGLQDRDLPRFRAVFEPAGYTVVASHQRLAMGVGGTVRVVAKAEPDAERLVVVSRDTDLAHACLRDELGNLERGIPDSASGFVEDLDATLAVHRRLGEAYGYPRCCVEAFCDAHAEVLHTDRLADNAIALLRAHLRTTRHDALLDTLGGQATPGSETPLRHLPCRFDCPDSLAQARALWDDLRQRHPLRVQQLESQPAQAVIVLADGSLVRVSGRLSAPGLIEDVTAWTRHLASVAPDAVRNSLATLGTVPPPQTALRLESGVGLSVRERGQWRLLALSPEAEGPLPSRFPVLLPFVREPSPASTPHDSEGAHQALHAAWEHARAGHLQACRDAVTDALALAPSSPRVRKIAGLLRYVTRDHHAALQDLAHAEQLAPGDTAELLRLAVQRLGRLGWDHELRAHLTRLAELEPQEIAWVSALAQLYEDRRVLPEGLDFARRCAELAPDAANRLRWARMALAADRPAEAIAAVADLQDDPGQVAQILCDAGAFSQAEAVLERAEPIDDVRARRAQLALWRGDVQQAEALARTCPSPAGVRTLGAIALMRGELSTAQAHLDAAIVAAPRDTEALGWRAELHLRQDRPDLARADLDAAMLAADGFHVAAAVLRALCIGRREKVGPLQPRFGEVLESLRILCPETDEVLARCDADETWHLLWRALERMHGNRSTTPTFLRDGVLHRLPLRTSPRHAARQALESLRLLPPARVQAQLDAVVARFPASALGPCHRGELHLWLGQTDLARADLRRALDMERTTRWAWIGLGGCELQDGAPERAVHVLAQGVKALRNTEGPAVFVYRGEAWLRLGRYDDAVRDLTEALRTRPTRIAARLLLALALHGLGDVVGMSRHFQDLRERAAGLLSEAGRVAQRTVWDIPAWLPAPDDMVSVCEAALGLLGGNRSSTCATWQAEGTIRAVPHEARPAAHPNARDVEDLQIIARLLREDG